MSIRSVGSTPIAPRRAEPLAPAAPAQPAEAAKAKPQPAAAAAPRMRQDSVAISDAARQLAALGPEARPAAPAPGAELRPSVEPQELRAGGEAGGLEPARLDELRRRVLEGAYNQTAVIDQVARRLLDRGDV